MDRNKWNGSWDLSEERRRRGLLNGQVTALIAKKPLIEQDSELYPHARKTLFHQDGEIDNNEENENGYPVHVLHREHDCVVSNGEGTVKPSYYHHQNSLSHSSNNNVGIGDPLPIKPLSSDSHPKSILSPQVRRKNYGQNTKGGSVSSSSYDSSPGVLSPKSPNKTVRFDLDDDAGSDYDNDVSDVVQSKKTSFVRYGDFMQAAYKSSGMTHANGGDKHQWQCPQHPDNATCSQGGSVKEPSRAQIKRPVVPSILEDHTPGFHPDSEEGRDSMLGQGPGGSMKRPMAPSILEDHTPSFSAGDKGQDSILGHGPGSAWPMSQDKIPCPQHSSTPKSTPKAAAAKPTAKILVAQPQSPIISPSMTSPPPDEKGRPGKHSNWGHSEQKETSVHSYNKDRPSNQSNWEHSEKKKKKKQKAASATLR